MASVSVVIPCFNQGRFLSEAVESVMGQTIGDIECLVVNDGSTDNTEVVLEGLVKKFGTIRVKPLIHPNAENKGVCASRNLALSNATGEFIAFLDADDIWLANKIERQLEIAAHYPEVDFVFSTVVRGISEDTRHRTSSQLTAQKLPEGEAIDFDVPLSMTNSLLKSNWIASPTPLVRSKLIKGMEFKTGPRSIKRRIQFEDWLMWLKLSSRTRFYCISEPLALYRVHNDQHTASFTNWKRPEDLICGTYEVLTMFLKDAQTQNIQALGPWTYLAKATLRKLIRRNINRLSTSDVFRIIVPCSWSGILPSVVTAHSIAQARSLARMVVGQSREKIRKETGLTFNRNDTVSENKEPSDGHSSQK